MNSFGTIAAGSVAGHPVAGPASRAAPGRQQPCTSRDPGGRLVCLLVSRFCGVPLASLMSPSRGKADICLARQTAMYLMHTVLSRSYHDVAAHFSRDRTTVAHACRLVEDMRDDPGFEERISELEACLLAARDFRSGAEA